MRGPHIRRRHRHRILRLSVISGPTASKASLDRSDPALKSAARAASLTAAVAYMHPDLVAATQLRHPYGPVVYAAQALELRADGNQEVGDRVLGDALSRATDDVRELARSMPTPPSAKTRLSHMYSVLDVGIR